MKRNLCGAWRSGRSNRHLCTQSLTPDELHHTFLTSNSSHSKTFYEVKIPQSNLGCAFIPIFTTTPKKHITLPSDKTAQDDPHFKTSNSSQLTKLFISRSRSQIFELLTFSSDYFHIHIKNFCIRIKYL